MSKAGNFIRNALPTVMTIVGSAATLAAVMFAAKGGADFKAATEAKEMTRKEKVKTGVKIFAPAGACALVSIGCGVGAHCLDLKTQASIVGAYTLVQSQLKKHQGEFDKYRKEIEKLYGEEADEKAMVEVKKEELPDEVKEAVFEEGNVGEYASKKITVHFANFSDDFPEQTIETTMEDVLFAIIRVNKMINTLGSITLNDALDLFGLDKVGEKGDEYGWSYDMLCEWNNDTWLDFDMIKLDDGTFLVYPLWQALNGFENIY